MVNQRGLDRPNQRKQQMKRELIGLVIGSSFLLTGTAFLFNQNFNDTETANNKEIVQQNAEVNSPKIADTSSVKDAPAPQATDLAANTVTPVAVAPSVATPVAPAALPAVSTAIAPTPVAPVTTPASNPIASAPAPTVVTAAPVATPPTDTPSVVTAEPATTVTEEATPTAPATPDQPAATQAAPAKPAHTGWIYAGQFVNGHWVEKGLRIGNTLPVAGQQYQLQWAATVRNAPPGKTSGGKNSGIKTTLSVGKSVTVVTVKASGTKGHYWLEVGL